MIDHKLVQAVPMITAVISAQSGEVTVDRGDGPPSTERFGGLSTTALRETVMVRAVKEAARVGRPLQVQVKDVELGDRYLLVAPTGDAESLAQPIVRARPAAASAARWDDSTSRGTSARVQVAPLPAGPTTPPPAPLLTTPPAPPVPPSPSGASAASNPASNPAGGPPARDSFITVGRDALPAEQGWRGRLNRLGLRLAPSPSEMSYRADVAALRRRRTRTKTIVVANSKGGAGKTPTCVCLGSVFGRQLGGATVVYDNNDFEGTARFRTLATDHHASILHLLADRQQLLDAQAASTTINRYVHHQGEDQYGVLWSDTTLDGDYVATGDDVVAVHEILSRYYEMVIVDTGNSHRAPNWRAAADLADALVVPCTENEDTAENGARVLETMHQRGGHQAKLAREAVVVVSQETPDGGDFDRIYSKWEKDVANGLAREVIAIPHDPALKSGVIRWDALRPETQRAWLRAGALVTEVL